MSASMSFEYFFLTVLAGLIADGLPPALKWLCSRWSKAEKKRRRKKNSPCGSAIYLDWHTGRFIEPQAQAQQEVWTPFLQSKMKW